MKTPVTKLKEAKKQYVKSVRILLATAICITIIPPILYFIPFVLLLAFWLPPCFIVLALLARENEKIKSISQWCLWMDDKMGDPKYINALLYIHHRQMNVLDPTEPQSFHQTYDLSYQSFLRDKQLSR